MKKLIEKIKSWFSPAPKNRVPGKLEIERKAHQSMMSADQVNRMATGNTQRKKRVDPRKEKMPARPEQPSSRSSQKLHPNQASGQGNTNRGGESTNKTTGKKQFRRYKNKKRKPVQGKHPKGNQPS